MKFEKNNDVVKVEMMAEEGLDLLDYIDAARQGERPWKDDCEKAMFRFIAGLHSVLNMPIDCWDGSELDKQQRRTRYEEASKRIIELEQLVKYLKEHRYTHDEVALWLSAYRGKCREKTLTDWVMEYREKQKEGK